MINEKLIDPTTRLESPMEMLDRIGISGNVDVNKTTHMADAIKYAAKPAFTSKRKTYISTPEAKLNAIRTAKDTAKSLGKVDYYNGLETAHAILQGRPPILMQGGPRWHWFRTDKTGIRG